MIRVTPDPLEAAGIPDVGAFVRGFLLDGEEDDLEVAALHGWENGFEGGLGDVDLVVSSSAFRDVVERVGRFAEGCGWRLCQVLRHESTAVFCVVAREADPRVVVALDICSDYRRCERVLMSAAELMEGREALEGGGFRVSRGNELRYRFLKAAVKGKDPQVAGPPLAAFPAEEKAELEGWLSTRWGVELKGWDPAQLGTAWKQLDGRTLRETRSGGAAGRGRVFQRLIRPTGLVIEAMDDAQSEEVSRVFGKLFFRRVLRVGSFGPRHFKALVRSTLVMCERVGPLAGKVLGRDLRLVARRDEAPGALVTRIAGHLADRCSRREDSGPVHG